MPRVATLFNAKRKLTCIKLLPIYVFTVINLFISNERCILLKKKKNKTKIMFPFTSLLCFKLKFHHLIIVSVVVKEKEKANLTKKESNI